MKGKLYIKSMYFYSIRMLYAYLDMHILEQIMLICFMHILSLLYSKGMMRFKALPSTFGELNTKSLKEMFSFVPNHILSWEIAQGIARNSANSLK